MDYTQLLDTTPVKGVDPNTTTRKFKQDLLDFFLPLKLATCVEIAGCAGNTTIILQHCFNQVVFVEQRGNEKNPNNFDLVLKKVKPKLDPQKNVIYMAMDVYHDPWYFRDVDVFFIDCNHLYNAVKQDIANVKKCLKPGGYVIFDDWSLPVDNDGVHRAIIDSGITIVKYIGEQITFNPKNVFEFELGKGGWEGVIAQWEVAK